MTCDSLSGGRKPGAGRVKIPPLPATLEVLHRAYQYAVRLNDDPWQFAVEARELVGLGAASCDLRWLIARGCIAHAVETTRPFDSSRSFRRVSGNGLCAQSCFVLTREAFVMMEAGEEPEDWQCSGARPIANVTASSGGAASVAGADVGRCPVQNRPIWDLDRRELRFTGAVVKRFKWPATNQEVILAVFEEEGWPARIDDPLPRHPNQEPKRRLHDTVKCLNRHQQRRLLRFRGDGTGEGVIWEAISDAPASA